MTWPRPAALAFDQGQQRADRRVQPRGVVGLGSERALRRLARVAVDEQHAAGRLRHEIAAAPLAARPRLPEGRDQGDDQMRMALGERRGLEAARPQPRGRARRHQHIRPARQVVQPLVAVRRREVEHGAALVGVLVAEREAGLVEAVGGKRTDAARWISPGRLELDHVRPHVRQELAAIGPALVGEVENANAGQGFPPGVQRQESELSPDRSG